MIKTLWKYLKSLYCKGYKKISGFPPVYLGEAPANTARAWIIFPYNPNILRCGIAAILEIKNQPNREIDFCQLLDCQCRIDNLRQLVEAKTKDGLQFLSFLEQQTLLRADTTFCHVAQHKKYQMDLQVIADRLQKLLDEQNWDGTKDLSQEQKNAVVVKVKDIIWRINKEFLENLQKIGNLSTTDVMQSTSKLTTLRHINSLFNMIDRLEIRGRDSAGIAIGFSFNRNQYALFQKYLDQWDCQREFDERKRQVNLIAHTIKECKGEDYQLTFISKVAAEIGELGDNVAKLRNILRQDRVLQCALAAGAKRVRYLAHTRWASNGIINIFNCHPLDNEVYAAQDRDNPYQICNFREPHPKYQQPGNIFVMLNGDIDNYTQLKRDLQQEGFAISSLITSDAKVIALEIERYLHTGVTLEEAFRRAVNNFCGSHAIVMSSSLEPDKVFLALKGSGQALYIGLAPDRYVVASEVYGIVEDSYDYLTMDGETPRVPGRLDTQGQICILEEQKGGLEGIRRMHYDGVVVALTQDDIQHAEITTRDIDRGNFPHFFLKEIYQAPESIRNTIRGKFADGNGKLALTVEQPIIPSTICQQLAAGNINKIYCIGQGTASIAAHAIAHQMSQTFERLSIQVIGLKASEFSGFYLQPQMNNVLVIAVTQSGTTTDTNRAVEMAARRSAYTIAIVNRRNSHITTMVNGVFYTSDGRDIEMAVASTKAFYSQVIGGEILTLFLATTIEAIMPNELAKRLQNLKNLPKLVEEVLAQENEIAELAKKWAPRYNHWAIVGSGANRIAAEEVRIKLSELCYKSIACDCIEDKKHIDLSAEPLILVCAAGTPESVLSDVVKDVAIFKAHSSAPIVIANRGERRFDSYAVGVIRVPQVDSLASIIVNAAAGHLFGYHAARSINNQARFFSTLRAQLVAQLCASNWITLLANPENQRLLNQFLREFHSRRRQGLFTAALSANTCADTALLLTHACGKIPVQQFKEEFGIKGSPENLGNLLLERLNDAIDELSRPIDAIKHQAKTVTVGTSRLESFEFTGVIFEVLTQVHVPVEGLRTDIIAQLNQIQPTIGQIIGYSYYRIDGLDATGQPTTETTIQLIEKTGVSQSIISRVEKHSAPLAGTKRSVVQKGQIFLGIGLKDSRPILIIPITGATGMIENLLLLHIVFVEQLDQNQIRVVLGSAYEEIKNQITEANIAWEDQFLKILPLEFLCTHSVSKITEKLIRQLTN